jgi:hypothetical protein
MKEASRILAKRIKGADAKYIKLNNFNPFPKASLLEEKAKCL